MHCLAQSGRGVLDSPANINCHCSNFLLRGAEYASSPQMALGAESSYLGTGFQTTFSVGTCDSRGGSAGVRVLLSACTATEVLTSGAGCMQMAPCSRGLARSPPCKAKPA